MCEGAVCEGVPVSRCAMVEGLLKRLRHIFDPEAAMSPEAVTQTHRTLPEGAKTHRPLLQQLDPTSRALGARPV